MSRPTHETTARRVYLDLRKRARAEARGTDELLVLYVLERFLYRLSISVHRDRLVLKGGMLLAVFEERRPTRDVDLLGMAIANDAESVAALVTEITSTRTAVTTTRAKDIAPTSQGGVHHVPRHPSPISRNQALPPLLRNGPSGGSPSGRAARERRLMPAIIILMRHVPDRLGSQYV